MNGTTRGIRNAFRNAIRTVSIVLILGLSVGLAVAMLVARQAVTDKITSVKSSFGNTINVSPAGVRGFEGGGEALTNEDLAKISALPNVISVSKTLSDRLTTENSSLKSAIEPGTLGNRQAGNSGVSFQAAPMIVTKDRVGSSDSAVVRTFTPPVQIIGTNDTKSPSAYGGSSISFASGEAVDGDKDEDKAAVGKTLAEKNNLSVGSTFTAYGKTITVTGIFDAGNDFANNGVVMSLAALQRLSGQPGAITSAVVTASSLDTIDGVVSGIETSLGDKADVISNAETAKESIKPLENVKSIALYSLIGALVAGAVIILLTMMMIVRERRREIGVMKAIGASNSKVVLQFVCEALTLTTIGLIVGLGIGVAAASPITNTLVTNSSNSTTNTVSDIGPSTSSAVKIEGGRLQKGGPRLFTAIGTNSVTNIKNIQASVGLDTIGYATLIAMAIAVTGSAVPALIISKIRPAEVMRAE